MTKLAIRSLGRHDFEGGGFVQITAGGDIETAEALEWVELLVERKRRELERRSIAPPRAPAGGA